MLDDIHFKQKLIKADKEGCTPVLGTKLLDKAYVLFEPAGRLVNYNIKIKDPLRPSI